MSETNTYSGRVVHVGQTETVGEKGFRKRLLVVTDESEKYPQEVPFEAVQDGVDKLDNIKVGDTVEVSYNIRGNAYNGKWYVNLNLWKVDVQSSATPTPAQPKATSKQEEAFANAGNDGSDHLPF